jgi:inner membrane protein YidH
MGEMAPEAEDATRRTRLANERTYLAWWRSGLTALAVGIAAGKLVPELTEGSGAAFIALGAAYAVLGIVFIVFAFVRARAVEQALARGAFAPLDDRIAAGLTGLGVLLGTATVLVVVFG